MEKIVIALATFKRPNMLTEALISLKNLERPVNYLVKCIICDNDPEYSARQVYNEEKREFPFDIEYVSEPTRGIVLVRNKLLKEAFDWDASFIAFFDDDEKVDSKWLKFLIEASTKFKAQAVSGSVSYILPDKAPFWLKQKNFYGGERPETGTEVRGASTNNVLIDLNFLKAKGLQFNEAFNMSGGSDSFLFREIRRNGGRIVSCREAITYEDVPMSRASEEWIKNRARKNGYTEVRRHLLLYGRTWAYLRSFGYSLWLGISYILAFTLYPVQNHAYRVTNRRRPKKITGIMLALLGRKYEEYRQIHGS